MLTGPGRRRLHRAIGAALADPDQAAGGLARGADEPDETLAKRAEQAARHASARGASARAAALAQAAAELTPDPGQPARLAAPCFLAGAAGTPPPSTSRYASLGEKWAPQVPISLRGRLAAVRADVEKADIETACRLYGEAFAEFAGAGSRPGRAGRCPVVHLPRHPADADGRGPLPHRTGH